MDFMTAVHLFGPLQLEKPLRHLMQSREMITTKLDRHGIQRQLDLGDLVLDPRLQEILSPNVILELRTLFVTIAARISGISLRMECSTEMPLPLRQPFMRGGSRLPYASSAPW